MNALERLYMKVLRTAAKKRRASTGGARIPAAERAAFIRKAKRSAKRKLPKTITIVGRRWFRQSYGNTYFTAEISVDGKHVHKVPIQGGYGDHYIDVAWSWLEKNGIVPERKRHPSGGIEPVWAHAKDLGIKLVTSVADVARERDL